MGGLRCDHIFAGAAVALLLAAPVGTLAQETAPAAMTASSTVADAPAVSAASAVSAVSGGEARTLSATASAAGAGPVAASAAPSAPAASPAADMSAPLERAIRERIRELLAAKPDRIFASENEHAAAEAFYQNRDGAPLWLDKGVENARGGR